MMMKRNMKSLVATAVVALSGVSAFDFKNAAETFWNPSFLQEKFKITANTDDGKKEGVTAFWTCPWWTDVSHDGEKIDTCEKKVKLAAPLWFAHFMCLGCAQRLNYERFWCWGVWCKTHDAYGNYAGPRFGAIGEWIGYVLLTILFFIASFMSIHLFMLAWVVTRAQTF